MRRAWPNSATRSWASRSTPASSEVPARPARCRSSNPASTSCSSGTSTSGACGSPTSLRGGRRVRRCPLRLRRHPAAPRQPGGADLSLLEAAIDAARPAPARWGLVIGKSTVPVGTADRAGAPARRAGPGGADAELAWNPEFLREGFAIQDTLQPDRLVFGVTSRRRRHGCASIYATPSPPVAPWSSPTSRPPSWSRSSANAFLATKISFINAMAEVCDVAGADVVALADALGHDARIGRKFLNAGIGFGGGCLPKDIRAFVAPRRRARRRTTRSACSARSTTINCSTAAARRPSSPPRCSADLAARPQVDRSRARRSSPTATTCATHPRSTSPASCSSPGPHVRVHDPKAIDNARARFPTPGLRRRTSRRRCEEADLVLHLTEWPEYRDLDPVDVGDIVATARLLDGRNALDPARWRAAGWTFRSIGRP